MSPSPIGKVLSTIRKHRVRALLMGGQACILYGAAEFSRGIDLVVQADDKNLDRLRCALAELQAEPVYFPPLGKEVLQRGHACHFRAQDAEAAGLRIDVMGKLPGCEEFAALWSRRRRFRLPGLPRLDVLDLPDLVQAKKTQRDKDWPMIGRLVEVDHQNRPRRPSRLQIEFWLCECRTPELLTELCRRYHATARRLARQRPVLRAVLQGRQAEIAAALYKEQQSFRKADHAYWQPLREELFRWRQASRKH